MLTVTIRYYQCFVGTVWLREGDGNENGSNVFGPWVSFFYYLLTLTIDLLNIWVVIYGLCDKQRDGRGGDKN